MNAVAMEQNEMNQPAHAEPTDLDNVESANAPADAQAPVLTDVVVDAAMVCVAVNEEVANGSGDVIDIAEAKRALEAALLAASEPMALNELRRLFDGQLNVDILRNLLDELIAEWGGRSVELCIVASGYRFRVKPVYQKYLDKLANDKPLKYSRAVMETLAIIAYRQPVTRGDIEDIRGVAVSPHILKTLEDRGWIDEIGNRETVGRPALFATTRHFLDDLNLRALDELPPLHELQATLDMNQFNIAGGPPEQTGTLPLGLSGVVNAGAVNDVAMPSAAEPDQGDNLDADDAAVAGHESIPAENEGQSK